MKNRLQIFTHEEFDEIRIVDVDGQPWFVGKDVADNLGYERANNAIRSHVDGEDKLMHRISALGQTRKMVLINESGLYSLILSSKLPQAKTFKRWVTSEVLPIIRKYGAYVSSSTLDEMLRNPEFAVELLRKLEKEQVKNSALVDLTSKLAPKALFCNAVLQSDNVVPVSLIAKDYGLSAIVFNNLLHSLGIQYRCGRTWLLYQRYANKGYTKTRTYMVSEKEAVMHTYWTQKGRLFLYETLKSCGIVPLDEHNYEVLRGGVA